jgi:hypothetical protein
MKKTDFNANLIAPCGANCGICVAFFGYRLDDKKRKHACPGCRSRQSPCAFIKKRCKKLSTNQIEYCFECADFPCQRLNTLDKRYRNKYGMSMIENLTNIQVNGIRRFLKEEREKWKCPNCGGIVCVHNRKCYTCNQIRVA